MATSVKGIGAGGFSKGNNPIPGAPRTVPGAPARVPALGGFGSPKGVQLHDIANGRFIKGGFGFEFVGLEGIMQLPDRFGTIVEGNIATGMARIAASMELYAKQNAPWTDRTGNARRGIKAVEQFDYNSGRFEIDLGHSVDYGFYLENANGGAYAIILPTVRVFQALLPATIKG